MKTLISLDPGLSSGVTIGTYSDTEPYRRVAALQFEGGLPGLMDQVRVSHRHLDGMKTLQVGNRYYNTRTEDVQVICEKFTPRPNGGGGLSLKSAEPLLCEGYLVSTGIMPYYEHDSKTHPGWVQPSQQYFSGGKNLAERKKASREFLKKHDLHLTGKMVGCKDADDAISATLHALSWLRKWHRPTQNHYFKED